MPISEVHTKSDPVAISHGSLVVELLVIGQVKLKLVKREIFLHGKELVLIDKYGSSIKFWSLSHFVNIH